LEKYLISHGELHKILTTTEDGKKIQRNFEHDRIKISLKDITDFERLANWCGASYCNTFICDFRLRFKKFHE
jgi:hypothetical protein